jgi:transposase
LPIVIPPPKLNCGTSAVIRAIIRDDSVRRLLMTAPGVGPFASLSFKTARDVPGRFSASSAVGAYFGLTPQRYQSGELYGSGRISKVGDGNVRAAFYEAASILLRPQSRPSPLKAWGMSKSHCPGRKRTLVAVARKLATKPHRMWLDGRPFIWCPIPSTAGGAE